MPVPDKMLLRKKMSIITIAAGGQPGHGTIELQFAGNGGPEALALFAKAS